MPEEPQPEDPFSTEPLPSDPFSAEPFPSEPLLPTLEEPAEPSLKSEPPGFPDSPATPGEASSEPSPGLPEPLPTPVPESLLPGERELPESKPQVPGQAEPVEPAPLDPTGEDFLPGLRSAVPLESHQAEDAASPLDDTTEDLLPAPTDVPALLAGEEEPKPGAVEPGESAPVADETTPSSVAQAGDNTTAESDPFNEPAEELSVRADWVSARNPGFRGWLLGVGSPRAAESRKVATGESLLSQASGSQKPSALPSDLAVEEVSATVPSEPDVEGPILPGGPDEGVLTASADAPAEDGAVEPSAFDSSEAAKPVALDGFCLFELSANERWVEGDPQWSAAHHGRTYLFSSQANRDRFLADPDRYAPAYGGYDPVLVIEGNRFITGKTDFCVNYDGRLYTFSSAATLARFQGDPTRYATKR